MKTAVIILNWNGFELLAECVESLLNAQGDFFIVVADNNSSDGSAEKFNEWLSQRGRKCHFVQEGSVAAAILDAGDILFYSLKDNYGFAKGNNLAIRLAMQSSPERILLLNNDTEVEPDFLLKLEEFQKTYPQYRVLTPLIYFGYDKTKIWNAGGKLSLGFRKYHYAGQTSNDIKEKVFKPITFVTGCALYVSPQQLDEEQILLTERFFFGEEDFEFSMSMNAKGVKMACVLDSVIYHKVGASGSRMYGPGKLYLHYLNRFIDIRLHKSRLFYELWALVNMPLCVRHFYKATKSFKDSVRLFRSLRADARRKEGVSHEDFDALVIHKTYFK